MAFSLSGLKGLGGAMPNINGLLQGLGPSNNKVHDFKHASKIFRNDSFRLHPKYAFLFYVRINLNPIFTMFWGQQVNEVGSLAKSVTMPRFQVDVKTLNAYNRVNLVQTKMKYDPVTIKFHDDGDNVIRELWYDYYSYYFRDSDHGTNTYAAPHKYQARLTDGWGYTLRNPQGYAADTPQTHLINSVQIFSFHQKRFSEVRLVNPIISSFRHGEHDMSNGTGLMEHEMTLNYETVTYAGGYLTQSQFGADMLLHYDADPSGISPFSLTDVLGSIGSIPGVEGLIEDGRIAGATDNVTYFRNGGTSGTDSATAGGALSAALGKTNTQQIVSDNNVFGRTAKGVAVGMLRQVMRGKNPLSPVNAPSASNLLFASGVAAGGEAGIKLIAAGGVVKAGEDIARGGVGPGTLGSAVTAIGSVQSFFGDNTTKVAQGRRVTTNGSPATYATYIGGTYVAAEFPKTSSASQAALDQAAAAAEEDARDPAQADPQNNDGQNETEMNSAGEQTDTTDQGEIDGPAADSQQVEVDF